MKPPACRRQTMVLRYTIPGNRSNFRVCVAAGGKINDTGFTNDVPPDDVGTLCLHAPLVLVGSHDSLYLMLSK